MEKRTLVDGKEVRITRKGISALVTYTNKKSPFDQYVQRQRCVWPNSLRMDNRIITKRVFGKGLED